MTGIERLIWRDRRRLSSSDNWVLPPMEWDSNFVSLAGLIGRNVQEGAAIYAGAVVTAS